MRLAFAATLLALATLGAAPVALAPASKVRTWLESGPSDKCVDVLFVGDGYTAKDLDVESGQYWKDVQRNAERLFAEEPFRSYKSRFNVRAAFVESEQSGCDECASEDKVKTAFECHFDTKAGRLLVFTDWRRLRDAIKKSGPTDIVFVMVNSARYGGSGALLRELIVRGRPCPAPTFAAQNTESLFIAVHELGHSFADLADEYEDKALWNTYPLPDDGDVQNANATLSRCFDSKSYETLKKTIKWSHFLALDGAREKKWAYEGAYYRDKGVFRPWTTCRMLNEAAPFCPVCCEEVAKAIVKACGDKWDDARWHKEHPLSDWH